MAAGGARCRPRAFAVGVGLSGGLLAALLVLPLAALLLRTGPSALAEGLASGIVGPALRLSLETSAVSLAVAVVLGTPLAWGLAQARGRGARLLETLLALPVVMPPAVAGIALLLAFGRHGLPTLLGHPEASLAFTGTAVVIAQIFVSAPLYVQGAVAAFRRLDPELMESAASLGAGPARAFFRVALPVSAAGLTAAGAMAWARALGEFGATLMFAGNLEGVTQTLPLAVYVALERDPAAAQALALLLLFAAFGLLAVVRGRAGVAPA
jgi:molybdate transport system permease protein